MRNLVISVILGLLLSSCATHHGTISSGNIEKKIKYVDIAIGLSQTKKIFGIGGMTKDALVLEAKREMIKNRPLQTDEQYLNFTLDFKNSFWPFIKQTKVILSADVVKFVPDSTTMIYSEEYLKMIGENGFINDLFSIGDSILFKNNLLGTILSVHADKMIKILYKNKKSNYKTKKYPIDKIFLFKKNKTYKGYKIGEGYRKTVNDTGEEVTLSGYVYGFGTKKILIKKSSGEIFKVDY